MTTNILGIRNSNTIIPYSGATKRTKNIDISAAISGTNITGVTSAKAIFWADSAGKWYMYFNIKITSNSVASIAIIIANITSVSTHRQGYLVNAGAQAAWGDIDPLGSSFTIGSAATQTYWLVNGTVELNAEPTTYTTAANMEGVVAVDVFVPEATATVAGIVGTGTQSFAGVKTFTGEVAGLGTVPVGSIIQSILTLAQFQAQAGTNWVLMDGASIVGSKLATITGWTSLPDATGMFLRTAGGSAASLATAQGQATAKNNLINSGSAVSGTASADASSRHTHSVGFENGTAWLVDAGLTPTAGPTSFASFTGATAPILAFSNSMGRDSAHSHSVTGTAAAPTISSTDAETRPVNLTVNTFIRIN